MKPFHDLVRWGEIGGPDKRSFNRELWSNTLKDESQDIQSRRLALSGLYFDEMFRYLRSIIKTDEIDLDNETAVRLAISFAIFNLHSVNKISIEKIAQMPLNDTADINIFIENKIPIITGELHSADEINGGTGDGLTFLLGGLLNRKDRKGHEGQINENDTHRIVEELNIATLYSIVENYWSECAANNYYIELADGKVLHKPGDEWSEQNRVISLHRRQSLIFQANFLASHSWNNKINLFEKTLITGKALAKDIIIVDGVVDNIILSTAEDVLNKTHNTAMAIREFESGYYKNMISLKKTKLNNMSVLDVMNAWHLLQSISVIMFEQIQPNEVTPDSEMIKFAPIIPHKLLVEKFRLALKLSKQESINLISFLTFKPNKTETWTQPLVRIRDNIYLLVSCIHSTNIEWLTEQWLQQSDPDLTQKGYDFEKDILDMSSSALIDFPFPEFVHFAQGPLQVKKNKQEKEEIDFAIQINNTIILIEQKSILWPESSRSVANYRNTIDGAIDQIIRKLHFCLANPERFRQAAQAVGLKPRLNQTIHPCVLINNRLYVGRHSQGVPVIDPLILFNFFKNESSHKAMYSPGKLEHLPPQKLYSTVEEAEKIFFDYLLDPPPISNLRPYLISRPVKLALKHTKYGDFFHETYQIDSSARNFGFIAPRGPGEDEGNGMPGTRPQNSN